MHACLGRVMDGRTDSINIMQLGRISVGGMYRHSVTVLVQATVQPLSMVCILEWGYDDV